MSVSLPFKIRLATQLTSNTQLPFSFLFSYSFVQYVCACYGVAEDCLTESIANFYVLNLQNEIFSVLIEIHYKIQFIISANCLHEQMRAVIY